MGNAVPPNIVASITCHLGNITFKSHQQRFDQSVEDNDDNEKK
jgi:hypothetical protein